MAGRRPHLHLAPEHCDQCGRCLESCPAGALRVGAAHIYIDWSACDGCVACAEACPTGAIAVKGAPAARAIPAPAPAVPKIEGAVMTFKPAKDVRGSHTWSLPEVAVVLLVASVMLGLERLALSTGVVGEMSIGASVALRAGLKVAYYAVLVRLLVALAARHEVGFAQAYGLTRPSWGLSAVWVLASLLAVRLLATMYGAVAQAIGFHPPATGATDMTTWFGADALGFALATVTVVFLGPFVEEVVFRGMLLPALSQVTGSRIGIIVSSVLFAASHLNLWTFVPLTLLGIALGWLRVSRDSTWPPVVLHALYNGVAVVAVFYVTGAFGGG